MRAQRLQRLGAALVATVGWLTAGSADAIEVWQADVGYGQLISALGPTNVPLGSGVVVSQVEAPFGTPDEINAGEGRYYPDIAHSDFTAGSDPLGQTVNFMDGSGNADNGISDHATAVGRWFYGNTLGLAKGVTSVKVYDANRWLSEILRYSGTETPVAQPFKVQNHSWIGTLGAGQTANDQSVLRRLDYVIETGDMTTLVGANNNGLAVGSPGGPTNPNVALGHPNLLAHSYNAIVVGRTDSRHSRGATTTLYGSGRFRPDIVSPATTTSAATGQVSGAAAMLHSVVDGTDAARSETMKAILLAGATKDEFAAFVEPSTGLANPWNRTTTRPLDDIFGAGEINVYNSYLMTVGGRTVGTQSQPVAAVDSYGWDYQDHKGNLALGDVYYNFDVAEGSTAKELSIILAWNAEVVDVDPSGLFAPSESVQNLNLQFYDSTGSFLGSLLDQSLSTVDNVEHIYLKDLDPGTYTLRVSGAADWDFAVAWRMAIRFNEVSADFNGNGVIDGGDFLVWQQNLGLLVGATNSQGDADGDGDVDSDDLTAFRDGLIAQPPIVGATAAFGSVPEPATFALAAAGLAALAVRGVRRRRATGQRFRD